MSLGIEGLVLFVLFVFPGVVARAEAQRGAAIPDDRVARTWVRELADALSYSAFLAPLAALLALLILWASTLGAVGLVDLLVAGPAAVVKFAPVQSLVAALTYLYVAFFVAWYVGGSRQASKIRAKLVDRFKFGEGLTDEPIWWSVLEIRAREYGKRNNWKKTEVFMNVHISGGGRYTGVLLYFTVAEDIQDKRDFALWKARYYAPGSDDAVVLPADDVVLLNTRDCDATEVRYVEEEAVQLATSPQSTAPASAPAPPRTSKA